MEEATAELRAAVTEFKDSSLSTPEAEEKNLQAGSADDPSVEPAQIHIDASELSSEELELLSSSGGINGSLSLDLGNGKTVELAVSLILSVDNLAA